MSKRNSIWNIPPGWGMLIVFSCIVVLMIILSLVVRTQMPKLPLVDEFEGNTVADFWLPGDYGSGRYAAGAVVLRCE
jgi:hypothetical protein